MADNVRRATQGDVDFLAVMAECMRNESPRYSSVSFSTDKMTGLLGNMVASPDCAVFVYEERNYAPRIHGMIGLFKAPYFFSDSDFYVSDLAVYVEQAHRGGKAGLALIRAGEAWAKSIGAREILLGVSAGIDAERVGGFYEKLGYAPATRGYVKLCATPQR